MRMGAPLKAWSPGRGPGRGGGQPRGLLGTGWWGSPPGSPGPVRRAGRRSAHLQADGAGQQDAESQRELFESVAEREAALADVHSLHHAGVAQLPQAQLPVEELRAQRQG